MRGEWPPKRRMLEQLPDIPIHDNCAWGLGGGEGRGRPWGERPYGGGSAGGVVRAADRPGGEGIIKKKVWIP